jgi:hypothetical protein
MRVIALFGAVSLALVEAAVAADFGSRGERYRVDLDNGPPYGGYYRSVPLVRYSSWIHVGPPYGGYYRTVPIRMHSPTVHVLRSRY